MFRSRCGSVLMAIGATLLVICGACGTATGPDTAAPLGNLMTPAELQALPMRAPDHRLAYGEDANQYGELRVPSQGGPHPVVVLIHGGCWKEPFATLRDLSPMGDALEEEGVATWNVEYRRLYQPGSGWGTYLDVGRAVDHLRSIAAQFDVDLSRVVVIGHSAGGHLAMWAAARTRLDKESPLFVADPLPVRGVVNLAGTIDMADNIPRMEAGCGDTVVTAMLGGTPGDVPERYAQASAITLVPLGIPQALVWGEHEDFVPLPLAEKYGQLATKAGDSVRIVVVPGVGHFELASPFSSAWPMVRSAIRSLLDGQLPP
jgi:acetyl esterase/lipase